MKTSSRKGRLNRLDRLAPLARGGAPVDLNLRYCPARKQIEEDFATLATRLFDLTHQLNLLIGRHKAFLIAKLGCQEVHLQLAELELKLKHHRAEHR